MWFGQFCETQGLSAAMFQEHDRQVFRMFQNRSSSGCVTLRIDPIHGLALEILSDIASHPCHGHQSPQQNVPQPCNTRRRLQRYIVVIADADSLNSFANIVLCFRSEQSIADQNLSEHSQRRLAFPRHMRVDDFGRLHLLQSGHHNLRARNLCVLTSCRGIHSTRNQNGRPE